MRRYVLWQLPGWAWVAPALWWLVRALDLSLWMAVVGWSLFVAKDIALYPAMRVMFAPARRSRPIGLRAEAVEPLRPSGYVRVNGELWKAVVRGTDAVDTGAMVVVTDAEGLTLVVTPVGASPGRTAVRLPPDE